VPVMRYVVAETAFDCAVTKHVPASMNNKRRSREVPLMEASPP
jgi:hypothetical protein